jgi:hypothetical protein
MAPIFTPLKFESGILKDEAGDSPRALFKGTIENAATAAVLPRKRLRENPLFLLILLSIIVDLIFRVLLKLGQFDTENKHNLRTG